MKSAAFSGCCCRVNYQPVVIPKFAKPCLNIARALLDGPVLNPYYSAEHRGTHLRDAIRELIYRYPWFFSSASI
jgi:hypothetical protein